VFLAAILAGLLDDSVSLWKDQKLYLMPNQHHQSSEGTIVICYRSCLCTQVQKQL